MIPTQNQSPLLLSVTCRDTKERLSGKCVNLAHPLSYLVTRQEAALRSSCWLPAAVITQKSHRWDVFKQQKPHLSRSWRPEVQTPGLGRATFPVTAVGQVLPAASGFRGPISHQCPWAVGASLPSACPSSPGLLPFPVCPPLLSLLYKHSHH